MKVALEDHAALIEGVLAWLFFLVLPFGDKLTGG